LRELVRLLSELTDQDKIIWSDTSEPNMFRATLSSGIIRIAKDEPPFVGGPPTTYQLSVLDQRNVPVEEFRSADPEDAEMIASLFQSVRRKALNLEQAWKTIMQELKQKAGKQTVE
jgi:hypothetical protein